MKSSISPKFENIVDLIYSLPLENKEELRTLLDHNISEARREEILKNSKIARSEHKAGKLKHSDSVEELKKML